MLSLEEIRAGHLLKKKTQAELAERIGITRSQLSSFIKYTNKTVIELTKILGENPFKMPRLT